MGSEKMTGLLLQNGRFQNGAGLIQKSQHSSSVEVGPEHNERSFCPKAQQEGSQSMVERRILRSQYRCLKSSIAEEQEEILNTESDKFDSIFSEFQSLHNQVCRPREQVADAEALLDITSAFLASVKSTQSSNGISLSDFVSVLAMRYSDKANDNKTHISWATLGLEASSIFSNASGASTMIGPMSNEPKQRRVVSTRKHSKPTESTRPETVADSGDQKSATDKNIATMFNILKNHKHARLEALVLNRQSFSQTVENIFALSFLVKDGRVEIKLDENKNHIVVPKNAPTAKELARGETSYSQFVFRFDFKDWKFMMESVETGQELMPHRKSFLLHFKSENSPSTPIRKISRNRGLEAPLTLNAQDATQHGSVSEDEEGFAERPAKRLKQLAELN